MSTIMKSLNSELIDPVQGTFSVLGLVIFRLCGPYTWGVEDIDDEMSKGTAFRAYEVDDEMRDTLDVASITVVDATDDPTEPDVSALSQDHVPGLDTFLHESIRAQLFADGMELIQWMSPKLNETENFKALLAAYIVLDQGKERQIFALRIPVKGRKVVAIGIFDIAKKDVLAAPIFNVLRNMAVLA